MHSTGQDLDFPIEEGAIHIVLSKFPHKTYEFKENLVQK